MIFFIFGPIVRIIFLVLIQNFRDIIIERFLLLSFQVKCGVRGDTSPGCNAVGMIDRRVHGIQHLYTRPVYLKTTVRICSNANNRRIVFHQK
jgi:hypothetical protein